MIRRDNVRVFILSVVFVSRCLGLSHLRGDQDNQGDQDVWGDWRIEKKPEIVTVIPFWCATAFFGISISAIGMGCGWGTSAIHQLSPISGMLWCAPPSSSPPFPPGTSPPLLLFLWPLSQLHTSPDKHFQNTNCVLNVPPYQLVPSG